MAHKSFAELEQQLKEAKKQVVIGGLYAHYKNPNHLYKVIDLAIQEASDQICVLYQSQSHPQITWVRNLDNWLEKVEVDDKKINRFEKHS